MKTVIYKAEGIYYTTTEENYAAGIQNARAIHKMQDFESAEEIIEYYCKYFGSKTEDFIVAEEGIKKMRSKDLIAVSGKLYEYFRYDKELKTHIVTEIEIDDEGNLESTYKPTALTDAEISNRGINLTEKQWIGLTKHFLRKDFDFPEEGIDEVAKNVVDSFATTRTPLVEELPNYIAIYLN